MYALLQAKLTDANWNKLECDHNASLRLCLGLPRHSKVASTLAKASWPLRLQTLRYKLSFVAQLNAAPNSPALLSRFKQRAHSHAAKLLSILEELVGNEESRIGTLPPPQCDATVPIFTTIPGLCGKITTPTCEMQQETACLLQMALCSLARQNLPPARAPPPNSNGRSTEAKAPAQAELVGLHLDRRVCGTSATGCLSR